MGEDESESGENGDPPVENEKKSGGLSGPDIVAGNSPPHPPSVEPLKFGSARFQTSSTPPTEGAYNPGKAQDETRTMIAWALLGITFFAIFGIFVMSAWALSPSAPIQENLKTILAVVNAIFGPLIALLGSVIGFYFGSRTATAAQAGTS